MILKSWSTDGIEDTTVGCYLVMILSILSMGNIIGSILNNLVGVFEFDVDESGNTIGKVWEWK